MRGGSFVRLGIAVVALGSAVWTSLGSGSAGAGSCDPVRAVQAPGRYSTVPLRSGCTQPNRPLSVNKVSKNVNVTNKTGAQSETTVAIDPLDSNHMLASSNDLSTFSTFNNVFESFDRGRTWTSAGFTENAFCYDPWLAFNASGDAFFSYECSDERIAYRKHGTTTWVKTILPAGSFPDRDQVTVDNNPGSPRFGSVYIGYDDNGQNNTAYVLHSADGFGGWVKSQPIDDTPTTVDVIGVNVATAPNGDVYATWEDFVHKQVRSDVSHDGGQTWGTDHIATTYRLATGSFFICIPPQPDRCVVPMPFTRADNTGGAHNGRLYVTYPDKDPSASDWNIYVRFSDNGGVTWSPEAKVNDDAGGAYQFFPAIAIAPDGTVAVSFYDTRNDNQTDHKTDRYVSYSTDGGATWSPNEKITNKQSDESGFGDANDYGDYEGTDASSTGFFQHVWADSRPGTKNEDMVTASSKL